MGRPAAAFFLDQWKSAFGDNSWPACGLLNWWSAGPGLAVAVMATAVVLATECGPAIMHGFWAACHSCSACGTNPTSHRNDALMAARAAGVDDNLRVRATHQK
mmetsp:Transcript_95950/g.271293  ORF Transcript_95950/g.271293 Transcript_95950/m.271293 type:complete len:103 (-) Transcript_95950:7-315(-)